MKRTLIVMRHAKTEPQQEGQKDFDRNLMERGRNDAKLMAERLLNKGFQADLILTSSANRTQQTTEIFKQFSNNKNVATKALAQLYLAQAYTIENEVMAIADDVKTLMIVGHNPGISEFVYECNPKAISSEMPTAAIVVFTVETENWQSFATAKKKLELYDYPKK